MLFSTFHLVDSLSEETRNNFVFLFTCSDNIDPSLYHIIVSVGLFL